MSEQQSASLSAHLVAFRAPLKNLVTWLTSLLLIQVPLTLFAEVAFKIWLVRIVPVLILIILLIGGYQLVKRHSVALLTPLPIFLGWSAAVFGIGPLYQWLTPDSAGRVSSSIFTEDVRAYADVALLNTSGLLLTVVGVLVMMRLRYRSTRNSRHAFSFGGSGRTLGAAQLLQFVNIAKLRQLAYVSIILASALRAIEYGLDIRLEIPGFLSFIDRAGWVAILLFAIIGAAGRTGALAVAAAVALVESFVGLIIGIRTEAIAPFLFLFIGYYIGRNSLKGLVFGIFVITVLLLLITPLTKEIRLLTWSDEFAGGRIAAVNEAYARNLQQDDINDPVIYQVWRRLDYSPWQASMMDLHDRGTPGDTYRYIFWTFVPRFIAPDKPRFEIGHDIGFAVQGVSQSSSFSGTVYGEMYWNGGWLALVVSSLIYGMLLGAVAAGTLWLFMQATVPAMLIGTSGLLYGFVPDDTFSVSAVGQAVIFFGVFAVYYQSIGRFYHGPAQDRRWR